MVHAIHKSIDIVMCDDNSDDISHLSALLTAYMSSKDVPYHLNVYQNGEDLLVALNKAKSGHKIVLLDMMMNEINGLSVAKQFQGLAIPINLIYVSSNLEMALHGYEVNALRYLAKPVCYPIFEEAMDRALERLETQMNIDLPTTNGEEQVAISDILYIEPSNRRSKVICHDRSIELSITFIQAIEQMKSLPFVQTHRTALVHLAKIQSIQNDKVILKNGVALPVSRYRLQELRSVFLEYLS